MSAPRTGEQRRLAEPQHAIDCFARRHRRQAGAQEAKLQLLEAASSRIGGYDLEGFHEAFGIRRMAPPGVLEDEGRRLASLVASAGLPAALALSALAREELTASQARATGAYHTDFRLALHLADTLKDCLRPGVAIVDPACGAGMLLAAASITACGNDKGRAADWLAGGVHAADLSAVALRGTMIALSSLTDDLAALRLMRSRWRQHDSLMAPASTWTDLAPAGFDVAVANPPWEKLKLSRHEFIKDAGGDRHYGAAYLGTDLTGHRERKAEAASYGSALAARYPALRDGEPDLYVAFVELLLRLGSDGGRGAFLAPAGLIRSKGTQALREMLGRRTDQLSATVMENRAAFFPIDTRFKFVVGGFRLRSATGGRRSAPLLLSHAKGTAGGVEASAPVRIGRGLLARVRPDLTVPEVRSEPEWRLFMKMQRLGLDWSDGASPWMPDIVRELDMTNARDTFLDKPGPGRLPVAEGRMVQHHRFGAKAYEGGEGRRARWLPLPPGSGRVAPQFWVDPATLAPRARGRVGRARAGFCDITGQTNERSMMAALIPPGIACGNKVPTVLFPNDPGEDRLFLWLAIANSLPFDWLLRRVVTTTVNFFLLRSLRLPPLEPGTLPGRRLVETARKLSALDAAGRGGTDHLWRIADLRAEADAAVAAAYGATFDELKLMAEDFPLLDRGQPPLRGEPASTVTRDVLLHRAAGRLGGDGDPWRHRAEAARQGGAVAYMLSQTAAAMEERSDVA